MVSVVRFHTAVLLPIVPYLAHSCGCSCCCSLAPLEPVHLSPEPRGSLSNLVAVPVSGLDAPVAGQVALAVKAVGLNFR